jgi:hypothetical protein
MVTFGRVLLWMVVLLAPGGFLLVPVLAAASLHSGNASAGRPLTFRERVQQLRTDLRLAVRRLQRYWTKS